MKKISAILTILGLLFLYPYTLVADEDQNYTLVFFDSEDDDDDMDDGLDLVENEARQDDAKNPELYQ